jgi:hypothetical protein
MSAESPEQTEQALAQDLYAAAHKFDHTSAVEVIALRLSLFRQRLLQQQLELKLRQRQRRPGKAVP